VLVTKKANLASAETALQESGSLVKCTHKYAQYDPSSAMPLSSRKRKSEKMSAKLLVCRGHIRETFAPTYAVLGICALACDGN
jgi:hypothetical protein